ncbi:MAG TPA: hypothetical protein VMU02_12225, partial [bacterium]|nr:hypothetical protein [bacterium]
MKHTLVALVCLAAFLFPVVVHGYTVNLEYGWTKSQVQAKTIGDYDYLAVPGSVYSKGSTGSVSETRRLPAGYKVTSYQVLDEQWEEMSGSYRLGVGVGEEMQALNEDDAGGLDYVGSANV